MLPSVKRTRFSRPMPPWSWKLWIGLADARGSNKAADLPLSVERINKLPSSDQSTDRDRSTSASMAKYTQFKEAKPKKSSHINTFSAFKSTTTGALAASPTANKFPAVLWGDKQSKIVRPSPIEMVDRASLVTTGLLSPSPHKPSHDQIFNCKILCKAKFYQA